MSRVSPTGDGHPSDESLIRPADAPHQGGVIHTLSRMLGALCHQLRLQLALAAEIVNRRLV